MNAALFNDDVFDDAQGFGVCIFDMKELLNCGPVGFGRRFAFDGGDIMLLLRFANCMSAGKFDAGFDAVDLIWFIFDWNRSGIGFGFCVCLERVVPYE